MKKILIFSLVYYPEFIGGAEVAIKEITDRLGNSARGGPEDWEFDMITLRSKGQEKFERIGRVGVYRAGLPFLGLTFNKYFFLKTGFWKAVFLHRKRRYNVIWSMMATYNSFAALFFKFFNPDVKFLLTLQEGDPIPHIKRRAKPLWPLFKMIFAKADCIQAISQYLADFAKEMGAKCPVAVVPNGANIEHFSRIVTDEEKQEVWNKYKKKEGDVWTITTSRLVAKNALGDAIEAMKFLPTNYKFIICGTGPLEEELKAKAFHYEFQDRVHFAGFVSHEAMPIWLQASDIFIRSSLSEGFGNSFIEAMAARIPVIATPVGGIVDFLKDKETGLFCRVNDPKSIAEKVLEISKDNYLRHHIVEKAFEMVRLKYDWDNVAGQMRNIFENAFNI